MKISFINKLPKKNNIIHISSREEKGNIKIESSLDIIKLSKSINTIIDYNTNMNKEVIFNLRKLNKNRKKNNFTIRTPMVSKEIKAFITKISPF